MIVVAKIFLRRMSPPLKKSEWEQILLTEKQIREKILGDDSMQIDTIC